MSVKVRLDADRQTVDAAAPVALFSAHVGNPVSVFRQQYVVSPDARRFLISTIVEDDRAAPITIIEHWKPRATGTVH